MSEDQFSPKIIAAAKAYCDLMAQARIRIDALREMLTPQFFSTMPSIVALESCFLQLRMITETIAIACLTAQGELSTSKLNSLSSADAIMNLLAKLHPEFYPIPERQTRNDQGGWTGSFVRDDGFIKRKDLTKLYGSLGDRLHIGSIKSRGRRGDLDIDAELKKLIKALAGIVHLLEWHTIVLKDPSVQLWVEMVPPGGGGVMVRLIRAENSDPDFYQKLAEHRAKIGRHG